MSAMSELYTAGASFLPDLGDSVAYMPRDGAPSAFPWRVAGFDRRRIVWRLVGPSGVFVDASPDEVTRLGRPDALERAAIVAPLCMWPADALREYLELGPPVHCAECGRARMEGGTS